MSEMCKWNPRGAACNERIAAAQRCIELASDLATAQRELGELTKADLRQVCADCEKQLFNNIAKMLDAGNVPSAGLDVERRVALLLDDNDVLAGQVAIYREAIAYATTVEPEAYLCDNEGRTGVVLTSAQFAALEDAAQAAPSLAEQRYAAAVAVVEQLKTVKALRLVAAIYPEFRRDKQKLQELAEADLRLDALIGVYDASAKAGGAK